MIHTITIALKKQKSFFHITKEAESLMVIIKMLLTFFFSTVSIIADEIINIQEFANTQHFVLDSHC